MTPVPNRIGIQVEYTTNVTIGGTTDGASNLVMGNSSKGVVVARSRTVGVSVRRNVITNNGDGATGLGIDLIHVESVAFDENGVTPNDVGDDDTGPNSLQNYPVLTSAWVGGGTTRVIGTLNSTPNTAFHLDFYANPNTDKFRARGCGWMWPRRVAEAVVSWPAAGA